MIGYEIKDMTTFFFLRRGYDYFVELLADNWKEKDNNRD